jgi:L-2-hydroxyglutarate oxidase LhgO
MPCRQAAELPLLIKTAAQNGVHDLQLLSSKQAEALEPALKCTAALQSPSTGILDSHS